MNNYILAISWFCLCKNSCLYYFMVYKQQVPIFSWLVSSLTTYKYPKTVTIKFQVQFGSPVQGAPSKQVLLVGFCCSFEPRSWIWTKHGVTSTECWGICRVRFEISQCFPYFAGESTYVPPPRTRKKYPIAAGNSTQRPYDQGLWTP